MKKTTLISGIAAAIIFFIAVIFKIFHWPGAGIAFVVSCCLFAGVYAPLLFMDKQKNNPTGFLKYVNIAVLLCMMIIPVSFLFKAMHWPGASIGLHISHLLLIILIPILLINAIKEKDITRKMNFFNETIVLIILAGFSIFIMKLTDGNERADYFTKLNERIVASDSIVIKNNGLSYSFIEKAAKESPRFCSSQLEKADAVKKISNETCNYIDSLKKIMLMMTTEFKDTSVLDTLHLCYLNDKVHNEISFKLLFAENFENYSTGKATELKQKIEKFKAALLDIIPEKEREEINLGLSTDSVKTQFGYQTWELNVLKTNSLVNTLSVLSELQLSVRIAEGIVLNKITAEILKNQNYYIYLLKNNKDSLK